MATKVVPMDIQAPVARPGVRNVYVASASAFLYVAVMGMVYSYSSPATVDMLRRGRRFRYVTADEITWIASLPNLSAAIGNLFSGYISQRLGRKAVLIGVSSFYVLSWLMVVYAQNVATVYAGRFLSGFCAGICAVAAPAYVVEIAPPPIRGRLSSGFQVAFSMGVLLVMTLGTALVWSWLAAAAAVLVALAAVAMAAMPESPTWLVQKSRPKEAAQGLRFLRGGGFDTQKEIERVTNDLAAQKEEGVGLQDLKDPTLYKPMLISVFLMFFQQFSGINPLMSYTVEIFQSAGSSIDPGVASAVVAVVQLSGTLISSSRMDKSGRRPLFVASAVFMGLALAGLGLYSLLARKNQSPYGWIPLACFVVYVFAYSLGVGPIPFVMTPEMTTVRTRSTVLAVAGVSCSVFSFVVTKVYVDMRDAMGDYGVFWAYAAVSFSGALFTFFLLPETKGMTILDIFKSFTKSSEPPR